MHSTTLPFTIQLPTAMPFAFSLQALAERLQTLTDHRARRGIRYPLAPMLLIAVLAKLAGHSHPEAISHWAKLRADDLVALFDLPHATMPHQTTWSRLFAHAVDVEALEMLLGTFFQEQQSAEIPARGSLALVVDGKTLRGTIPLGHHHGVHLVAAYLPEQGVVLAQLAVDRKENEIVVVPSLLAQLDLRGMVVLGDAMQAQRALSAQIVEAGGDYLWFVKANQPGLYDELTLLFDPPVLAAGEGPVPTDFVQAQQVDRGHGRLEVRRVTVSALLADYSDWPYLAQVFQLERWVEDGLGRTRSEVRYGVTSLPATVASAERVLALTRTEWQIENALHYRRDVTLQEDGSQLRRGRGPQVLAALNNAVLGVAQQHGVQNLAAAQRAFTYQFDRMLAHRYS